ncbi:inositol polyphosphate 5-phosphatase [Geopyxis carbonaria]|nr:inositol polyphosphate 5-phosphatase [Geopyxis carbonaria]
MASLYLLTLNCARELQSPSALSAAITPTLPPQPPALLILSLQELLPLAPSFLGGTHLTPYTAPLSAAISTATKEAYGTPYAPAAFHNAGFTALFIFTSPSAPLPAPPLYAAVGLGVAGMGNKGAVGIRVTAPDSNRAITFVGAHLAPHEFCAARRDADWADLVRGLVFTDDDGTESGIYEGAGALFVAGDLNYRTSDARPQAATYFPAPREPVAAFKHMLSNDQLTLRRKDGATMHGLREAPVGFRPTYKYAPVDSDGDSEGEEKWAVGRYPSWTDRILYAGRGVKAGEYGSLQGYTGSDHKPVYLHATILESESEEGEEGEEEGLPESPFAIDAAWRSRRAAARMRETCLGATMVAAGSWVVWGVVLAVVVGALGTWWVVQAGWVGWEGLGMLGGGLVGDW